MAARPKHIAAAALLLLGIGVSAAYWWSRAAHAEPQSVFDPTSYSSMNDEVAALEWERFEIGSDKERLRNAVSSVPVKGVSDLSKRELASLRESLAAFVAHVADPSVEYGRLYLSPAHREFSEGTADALREMLTAPDVAKTSPEGALEAAEADLARLLELLTELSIEEVRKSAAPPDMAVAIASAQSSVSIGKWTESPSPNWGVSVEGLPQMKQYSFSKMSWSLADFRGEVGRQLREEGSVKFADANFYLLTFDEASSKEQPLGVVFRMYYNSRANLWYPVNVCFRNPVTRPLWF